ncbi:MAG: zinc-ribbon domain-containing protein [Archangium sp.]|nr:zinc-ribbon domain-containing protein [Archangium sp.]
MIVKCEQCQTRFKIPDEKVTEKGVKVRCTKCGHTFRVAKESSADAATGQIPALQTSTQVAYVPPGSSDTVLTVRPPPADPFSAFGTGQAPIAPEATRPGVFALGVEATRLPNFSPPSAPRSVPATSAPFDFSTLIPTAPPPAVRPAPTRSIPAVPPAVVPPVSGGPRQPTVQPAPFDFSALGPPSTAPAAGSAPFDFSALGPSAPPPPRVAAAPAAFDFGAVSPPPPSAPPAPPPPPSPPPAASLLGDIPPAGTDEFFTTSLPTDVGRSMLEDVPEPSETATDSFEAAPGAVPPDQLDEASAVSVTVARLTKPKAEPASSPSGVVPVHRPRPRTVFGVIINLIIAVLLVLALVVVGSALLNDGKVNASLLSAKRLQALFSSPADFVPADISNGLYDTRNGKPVFYVRGEVLNRSGQATRVLVRAEIVDGDTEAVVRTAEVMAGAPPTPEQLHALSGADDVKRLLAMVSDAAGPVEPGQAAPFVVTFFEYPPDLKAFRVRVVASAAAKETAAR